MTERTKQLPAFIIVTVTLCGAAVAVWAAAYDFSREAELTDSGAAAMAREDEYERQWQKEQSAMTDRSQYHSTPSSEGGLPQGGPNMRTDTFTLEEGPTIALQYPSTLSQASYEDFQDWMQIELRKLKRLVRSGEDQSENTESQ